MLAQGAKRQPGDKCPVPNALPTESEKRPFIMPLTINLNDHPDTLIKNVNAEAPQALRVRPLSQMPFLPKASPRPDAASLRSGPAHAEARLPGRAVTAGPGGDPSVPERGSWQLTPHGAVRETGLSSGIFSIIKLMVFYSRLQNIQQSPFVHSFVTSGPSWAENIKWKIVEISSSAAFHARWAERREEVARCPPRPAGP